LIYLLSCPYCICLSFGYHSKPPEHILLLISIDMTELKPNRGNYYLWLYVPSTPAAALFTALFALGTAAIVWRMIRSRAWFCTVFVIGGIRKRFVLLLIAFFPFDQSPR
jgi:hypothetical protein